MCLRDTWRGSAHHGAGKAVVVWAWGVLVCCRRVVFAEVDVCRLLLWICEKGYVKIWHLGYIGKVFDESRRGDRQIRAWRSSMTLGMIGLAVVV